MGTLTKYILEVTSLNHNPKKGRSARYHQYTTSMSKGNVTYITYNAGIDGKHLHLGNLVHDFKNPSFYEPHVEKAYTDIQDSPPDWAEVTQLGNYALTLGAGSEQGHDASNTSTGSADDSEGPKPRSGSPPIFPPPKLSPKATSPHDQTSGCSPASCSCNTLHGPVCPARTKVSSQAERHLLIPLASPTSAACPSVRISSRLSASVLATMRRRRSIYLVRSYTRQVNILVREDGLLSGRRLSFRLAATTNGRRVRRLC